MTQNNLQRLKKDFVTALRIISHEGLSDAFAHPGARGRRQEDAFYAAQTRRW
jgi:hypothetical protein